MSPEAEIIELLGKAKGGVQVRVNKSRGYNVVVATHRRSNSKHSLLDALTQALSGEIYDQFSRSLSLGRGYLDKGYDKEYFDSLMNYCDKRHISGADEIRERLRQLG